ncbi:UvrD-helicase domain-containing protein [Nocardioides sp. AE5]|uniref:UvrD-helicase domain-containing protein n=1 Tax=Nocardioides sp. AE5 TaxID=2962573 RepID=UPI0028812DC6|nr:UvrD-helicase domain-containing protein [Nocardioides sp. AE5]MDT0202525.1 UvrD-helicase domain-containing protein [Nocardioides sp. AE5]
MTQMEPFDLLGDLPRGTTVLEASAGTGKTYTLAALVTRYVAEGEATLDEMLLITFGRAASRELRERVREQLVAAERALAQRIDDPTAYADDAGLLGHLIAGTDEEVALRRRRLRVALAGFDAATIATTHQFCQLVLRSLGVAGDTDAGVTLVDDLDDLVTEVVDDLYLGRHGKSPEDPPLSRAEALAIVRAAAANPHTALVPDDAPPGSVASARVEFARAALAELETRKRRLGVLGYDDLLTRLARALEPEDAPARRRMAERWRIVMVDEFQDTDPVQWQVLERAFGGRSTLILIGDPKQAIYAFRGGDIETYLQAAATTTDRRTLGTNWRSDKALVDTLQVVLGGAALGNDEILVRPVEARHTKRRVERDTHTDPFRLRVAGRARFGITGTKTIPIGTLRPYIAADMAADIGALLADPSALWCKRRVRAGDVAVIVENHTDARVCREALAAAGIPAVYTGDADIFASEAAQDWLALLRAMDQPHRSGLVRAAATTMFFGEDAESLHTGGDALTERIGATLRTWADHLREHGAAAVFEAAQANGMAQRVLGWQGGERRMTDLRHLAEILHERAHAERMGLPGLLEWVTRECNGDRRTAERSRRLDSDAAAVQIMTVWVSKGLQYPFVYLPFGFNRNVRDPDLVLFHRDGVRSLDIGGKHHAGFKANALAGRAEMAGDDIRLTYVALTRAQGQVVAWWAPSWDEPNGGISRLLRGRAPGQQRVPDRVEERHDEAQVKAIFDAWAARGGPVVEVAEPPRAPDPVSAEPAGPLGVRAFTRTVDAEWRRTSYSGLVRASERHGAGVASEPAVEGKDDEPETDPAQPAGGPPGDEPDDVIASPMAHLPGGAAFGSLVHAVLEHADPEAPDLGEELMRHVRAEASYWPVQVGVEELAEGLVPLHDTPLGPLADGLTLRQVPLRDRLRELDFEIPLAGGDLARSDRPVVLAEMAPLLEEHLAADDPMRAYADRLRDPALGGQTLRGYLAGSIDVVLRIPGEDGSRFVVVDYKTNRLGVPEVDRGVADYLPDQLAEAMLHSDYPLQALVYSVVLHRYLRWRLAGYDPRRHLGGVLYLYLRGMAGARTPEVDGVPAGVFSWAVPPALVEALSDLFDARRPR